MAEGYSQKHDVLFGGSRQVDNLDAMPLAYPIEIPPRIA